MNTIAKAVTPEEQLQLLKAVTIRTGAIHDAQALQLKMWPTLIPGVYKSEARVNVDKKIVTFVCESNSLRATKRSKLLYANIAKWTQNILWNETKVIIKINDKAVYNSSNP
jgi:hypothetical protein